MMFEFAEDNGLLNTDRLADIKVVGVGGAGGNAVGRMIEAGLVGVEFFAVNTDLQALHDSPAHRTLQIGAQRTKGLGSGGNPSVGRAAAEEDLEQLRDALSGADMVFVTAGMGGGTGTGAAPVIARVARELGALTVAIVTKPFRFEASVRMQQALAGIEELRQSVDTLIIIPNQRLLEVVPAGTSMREAFRIADNVLYEATRGIYEIISRHDHVNLDFADVRTVMKDMGQAMMGTGRAEGPNRAVEAARQAISSPLLENVNIHGSRAVLVNVLGREVGLQDTAEAMEFIQDAAGPQAHVIFGYGNDESMGDMLQLTVIATGFDAASTSEEVAAAQARLAATLAAPVAGSVAEEAAEDAVEDELTETVVTWVDDEGIEDGIEEGLAEDVLEHRHQLVAVLHELVLEQRRGEGVQDGLVRIERRVGVLVDHLHGQAVGEVGLAVLPQLLQVDAVVQHLAGGRPQDVREDLAEGRLAAAALSDHGDDLARLDVEVDLLEDLHAGAARAGEDHVDLLHLDQAHDSRTSPPCSHRADCPFP